MANTYTVKVGDTLSEIAEKYKSQYGYSSTYDFVDALVKLNNIKDADVIVVGQTIKFSGTATSEPTNNTSKPTIDLFGLQSNADRTIYVTWTWSKSNTKEYQVIWYYDTGDGVWFIGNDSKTTYKQSLYNAPSNAKSVKVKIKPISETHTVNKKETTYWTAGWSTERKYIFSASPPAKPSAPTVTIDGLKLTASLTNISGTTATDIEFQIVYDHEYVFKTASATIKMAHAAYSCNVTAGREYKVRCRGVRSDQKGEWSEYSTSIGTQPSVPDSITEIRALSETSVHIEWTKVANATGYTIEYTTQKIYFDSSSEVKSTTVSGGGTHAEITGLETGQEHFFRVRAVNNNGESGWAEIKSIVIGEKPSAPTTWSSTTTAVTGEALNLYWVHNAQDGSNQTYSELELYINGVKETHTIQTPEADAEENKTNVYPIGTSSYAEGSKIQWRVRTAGITKEYGDWSIQRTIDVYAPPTLSLTVTNGQNQTFETLMSFPFTVRAVAGPNTQAPTGYHLSIIAQESYETIDVTGTSKWISKGDEIYSKYFDVSSALNLTLSAGDLDLENNVEYTILCSVSMNSGLRTEDSFVFNVAWDDDHYEPNAQISINMDTYTASIMPYCSDENAQLVSGISLSVYRREFDGKFTEIASGLDNMSNTFVTDPHPSLDYARYRIVAMSNTTGAVSYYDVPGVPVDGKEIVIQWDEKWSSFNSFTEDALAESEWTGSMLKFPYNVDVSEKSNRDVALVKYIGREEPVKYTGTQLGTGGTWSTVIKKDDKETIYGLRRLQRYTGDVYVREPSGVGYWANVEVSFSQKHKDLTIPVSFDITRVAGGM